MTCLSYLQYQEQGTQRLTGDYTLQFNDMFVMRN